ncbi:MAG: ABC transporter permease, partial [Bacteroidota bacterium]
MYQLKIILRSLLKQKTSTFIHVFGLALGLSCCFFIYLFIYHECSFDSYHPHPDRTYRVNWITGTPSDLDRSASVPNPVAEALRLDVPDFEKVARVYMKREKVFRLKNKEQFKLNNIAFAEPELLDLFTYTTLRGNLAKTLSQPGQVAISESVALQLFGDENPIGKIIQYGNTLDLEVSCLIKNPRTNTHLPAQVLISYQSLTEEAMGGMPVDSWTFSFGSETFVLLSEGNTPENFTTQLDAFSEKYMRKAFAEDGETSDLSLQALQQIHFDTRYPSGSPVAPVRPIYLWIFACIGFFVLAIATFNFINLSTAQATRRANEIGVRKVLGAGRKHLIVQFLGESLLISALAGILAIAITQLFLPTVNTLLQQQIATQLFYDPITWSFFVGLILIVGFLSGIYPAIGLSRFQPSRVLKSKNSTGNRRSLLLRRSLVVAQFTITLVLLIGTLVISQQVNYLKNKDLGFNQEAKLLVELPEQDKHDLLRQDWMQDPAIEKISFALGAPTSRSGFVTVLQPKGKTDADKVRINAKAVDRQYLDTYELELVAGRWMNEDEELRTRVELPKEERRYKFVVNEALVRKMGYAHPDEILGKEFQIGINQIETEVIGVVKDFNVNSLRRAIMPTVMLNIPQYYYAAGLKVDTRNLSETISHVEAVWSKYFPDDYFEYTFL